MTDEQLYIDGQLVDINDGTNITLSIASNLFRDISKMVSNKTYTFRLPRTTHNARVLQFVDNVSASSTYPYRYHKARYMRGGVELIADGQATILSASAEEIEMCIVWGLYPALSTLVNEGKTLTELVDDNATITWHDYTTAEDYVNVANMDYFYAAMYFIYRAVADEWWHNAYEINPYTTTHPDPSKLDYLPSEGGRSVSSILNPSVKMSYLLREIKNQFNVDFKWTGDALTTINNLIIPLTTRIPTQVSFPDDWRVHFDHSTHVAGRYTLNLPATTQLSSTLITPTSGSNMTYMVQQDVSVMFKIKGRIDWMFDDLIANMKANNDHDYISGWFGIGVKHDGENDPTYYRAGHYRQPWQKIIEWDELNQYNDVSEFIYGNGVVELRQFDELSFVFSTYVVDAVGNVMNGHRPKLAYCTCDVSFSVVSASDIVPDGAQYPIMANLPEIKVVDMVRCLAAITGTFPLQLQQGAIEQVSFAAVEDIWANIPNAVDWSNKLVAQSNENVAKKLEWNMAEWAQNNWFRWKEDDTIEDGYADGNLTIPNDTLDVERDIVVFPFAASNGNEVPCNELDTGTYKPRKCEPRLMTLYEDENGKAAGTFDMDMQEIIPVRYGDLAATLQDIHVITETFIISDWELLNFDETIPIYLRQYGAYFAVLEIKSSKSGVAEVQLLKLKV